MVQYTETTEIMEITEITGIKLKAKKDQKSVIIS